MKKGQVYRAKRNNWILAVITLIVGGVFWYYFSDLLTGDVKADDVNMGIYRGISILFTAMFTLVFWLIGMIWIWSGITKRQAKLKADRYRYFYNRCIDLFKEGKYDQIKKIHNNRLMNSGFDELSSRIRLAWRVANLKDLDSEKLIPTTPDPTPPE